MAASSLFARQLDPESAVAGRQRLYALSYRDWVNEPRVEDGTLVAGDGGDDRLARLESLGEWSGWLPFTQAMATAQLSMKISEAIP